MAQRHLHIGYIMEFPGRSYADWKHPGADPASALKFEQFRKHIQIAEAGKLDFVFIADNNYVSGREHARHINRFEPLTLFSALSVVTKHIGLGVTVGSTFTEPFNLARYFASLDHLSGGRAGWNLVTTSALDAGSNFSRPTPEHDKRYEIAEEHLDVVQGLWDSWEEDALLYDRESGRFHDPDKLHALNHKGRHFQVKGPLNISRTPQGQPVIFQAGDSAVGRRFAAKRADAIFALSHPIEKSRETYKEIKSLVAGFGRNPDQVLIMPAQIFYVGSTEAEAKARFDERTALLTDNEIFTPLKKFFSDFDREKYDLDGPFPMEMVQARDLEGLQSHIVKMLDLVKQNNWSIRQLATRLAAPPAEFMGTPEQIADRLQLWLETRGADGFIFGQSLPGQLELFCREVVPILQKRGIFRQEYEGTTLRESLGIDQPPNRYTMARMAKASA